jgi:hypothetical protein
VHTHDIGQVRQVSKEFTTAHLAYDTFTVHAHDIGQVRQVSKYPGLIRFQIKEDSKSNIGCSERRMTGHWFYRRNFLRKSCATCREKCRRTASRTEKSGSLHNEHRVYSYTIFADEHIEYCTYQQWKGKHHQFYVAQLEFLTILNDIKIILILTTNLM